MILGVENVENALQPVCGTDIEAISYLKRSVAEGKHWYIAMLETIGMWQKAEEELDGHHYCYLVAGEAFDWLLLAERLCLEMQGFVIEEEKINLLFFATPPLKVPPEQFKNLIGDAKYTAYLNYFYGVAVEESLILVAEDEVRKELSVVGLCAEEEVCREAYTRIYGADMDEMLARFRQEKDYHLEAVTSLPEIKEFTYWLFHYRLKRCDKARVASDTKKALTYLQNQQTAKRGNFSFFNVQASNITDVETSLNKYFNVAPATKSSKKSGSRW